MARTQRIRRKELRQPDEFQTLTRRAIAYAETNRTTAYLLAGGAIVLLAAVLTYGAVSASRESAAAQAYHQAHTLLDDRKYAEAATAFQEAANAYSSSKYGILAQLQAANALLLAERGAEAATAYEKFLKAPPPSPELEQLAQTRLGVALEQGGKVAEARTAYGEAARAAGPFTEDAMLGEARAAEQLGDGARAKELYAQLLEKYPMTDSRSLVQARLAALGWTPPASGAGADEPEAEDDDDAAEDAAAASADEGAPATE